MGETHVFKTTFSRFFPPVFTAVGLAAIVLMVAEDAGELTQSVPFVVAAVLGVWVVFGFPRAEVSDGGITLVNIVRTVHIPWPCFTGADSRWNLRIDTPAGSFTSWARPTGSGTARRLPRRRGEASATFRQLRGNTAEAAVVVIGERAQQLKEAGFLDAGTLGRVEVETSLNRPALIAVVVAGLAVVAGVL